MIKFVMIYKMTSKKLSYKNIDIMMNMWIYEDIQNTKWEILEKKVKIIPIEKKERLLKWYKYIFQLIN